MKLSQPAHDASDFAMIAVGIALGAVPLLSISSMLDYWSKIYQDFSIPMTGLALFIMTHQWIFYLGPLIPLAVAIIPGSLAARRSRTMAAGGAVLATLYFFTYLIFWLSV